ncbi:MAG: pterin-4-alpha-carbinolamine dehydratase [Labilithrix sp.]|nr:pterin-4-alpha-carbinolamine dehydratase [Labilithrix sp.]
MNKLATIVSLALAAVTIPACAAESADEPSGSTSSEIIGGAADYAHPSVAYLRSVVQTDIRGNATSVAGCTATLIAPSVMVTAAHCTTGSRLWNEVNFDPKPNVFAPFGSQGWIPAALVAHPLYDGDSTHGHDVAVVLLRGDVQWPLVRLGAPPPVGSTLTAVGYGMVVFGNDGTGSGERRAVSVPLLSLAPHEMTAGRDGQSTCHGDSGGPLFAGETLIGITSYGDTVDCHDSAHFMRADDNIDFLRRYVPSL